MNQIYSTSITHLMCPANWGKLQACGNVPCNSTKLSMPAILRQRGREPEEGFTRPLLALSGGNVSSRALQKIRIHYLPSTHGVFNTLGLVVMILFITFCQDATDSTTLILINPIIQVTKVMYKNCSTAFSSIIAYDLLRYSVSFSTYVISNDSLNQWIMYCKGHGRKWPRGAAPDEYKNFWIICNYPTRKQLGV